MNGSFFECSHGRAALFAGMLCLCLSASGFLLQAKPKWQGLKNGTPNGASAGLFFNSDPSASKSSPKFYTMHSGPDSGFFPAVPSEINFGADPKQAFRVHAELERWARNHNLLLVPDSPLRDLQDGLARVIESKGLRFSLRMPKNLGRAWLYLDIVTYRPLGSYEFSRVRWLDVYSNGILLKVLYQGGGKFLKSPVRLALDREHAPDGIARIELRPSPGDGAWAIWDAFVSRYRK